MPGATDDASLSAPGNYTVTSDASVTVNSLTTAKGATLEIAAGNFNALAGTGTGVNAGNIQVADGASFEVGGSFDNTGKIGLDSTGNATTFFIDGSVTLTGAGKVVLSNNPNNAIAGDPTNGGQLINDGNTISGAGQIGGNNLVLLNLAGTIDATSATHALTTNIVTNSGLMEATGGGMLIIDSYVNNYVGSNLGTIKASGASATVGGSTVNLHGGTIVGGAVMIGAGGTLETTGPIIPSAIYSAVVTDDGTLLATANGFLLTLVNTTINATISETNGVITGGLIEAGFNSQFLSGIVLAGATINGGALDGGVIETLAHNPYVSTLNHVTITAGSTVTVVDDTTLMLTDTITNDGTIALDSSGDTTTLEIGTKVTLTGGGALTLSDVPPAILDGITNDIVASGASAARPFTLTNTNDTISGAGSIGDGDQTLMLINQAHGVIDATGANALTIDTGNKVTNAGILEATNPNVLATTGGLVIDDAVANSGTIEANGGNVTVKGALSGGGQVEIFGGNTVTLGGSATNGVTFEIGENSSLILNVAQSFSGKVTGLASHDSIDLTNFAFATTSITKITGGGSAGSVTNVTLTDSATHLSETLHLVNTSAGQFGTTASDYSLTPDNHVSIVGTLFEHPGVVAA